MSRRTCPLCEITSAADAEFCRGCGGPFDDGPEQKVIVTTERAVTCSGLLRLRIREPKIPFWARPSVMLSLGRPQAEPAETVTIQLKLCEMILYEIGPAFRWWIKLKDLRPSEKSATFLVRRLRTRARYPHEEEEDLPRRQTGDARIPLPG